MAQAALVLGACPECGIFGSGVLNHSVPAPT